VPACRSILAATIYDALDGTVETIFSDAVASIEEAGACVWVGFDHAPPWEADLVIGADGLHSRVHQLVFGADTGVEVRPVTSQPAPTFCTQVPRFYTSEAIHSARKAGWRSGAYAEASALPCIRPIAPRLFP
jgi:2-polyprenyl-6-methoxyphenol hydroxylase-like FAD-dependent oxidoreductase